MKPLTTGEIVDALDRYLELAGQSPWPELGDSDDAFPVDWSAVDADSDSGLESIAPADDERERRWVGVDEELRSRVRPGGGTPPPVLVDALAWYQPIHYFGHAWGIYICESAVLDLAAYFLEAMPESRRFEADVEFGAIRMGLGVLYLHEAFHHRMESFAIALEVFDQMKIYCRYHDKVFKPLRAQGSDDLLEEALATAESYRRLRESVYRRSVPTDLRKAARPYLRTWFKTLPPGYSRAGEFFRDAPFESALHHLSCQIDEMGIFFDRPPAEWRLTPQLYRPLFNCRDTTWVVVPIGQEPMVPWFGRDEIAPLSVSSRDLVKVLRARYGYDLVPGGKHQKLVKPGMPTIPIPSNREALSYPVLKSIANALGFGSARDMWETLSRS
jgi:hypothetical protein